MKLKIWTEDTKAEEDTCYFRLVEGGNEIEVNIVTPEGWYVLGISEKGLERWGGLSGSIDRKASATTSSFLGEWIKVELLCMMKSDHSNLDN